MSFPHSLTYYLKSIVFGPFRFFAGLTRSVFKSSTFEIKPGYIHRKKVFPHDDRGHKDENQKEVYLKASAWMQKHGLTSVIDMGCGSGFKLIKYLGQYQTLGIDVEPVISHTATIYPRHQWMNALHFIPSNYAADLILCADTIEHVPDPDEFLKSITSIQHWKYMIISTPERNMKRGWYHFGPPPNSSHYREWSKEEFLRFLSKHVQIIYHEISNSQQATLLCICQSLKGDR